MTIEKYKKMIKIIEVFNEIIKKLDKGSLISYDTNFDMSIDFIKSDDKKDGSEGKTFKYTITDPYRGAPEPVFSVNFYDNDSKKNPGKVNGEFSLCSGSKWSAYKFDIIRFGSDSLLLYLRCADEITTKNVFILKGSYSTEILSFFENDIQVIALDEIKSVQIEAKAR